MMKWKVYQFIFMSVYMTLMSGCIPENLKEGPVSKKSAMEIYNEATVLIENKDLEDGISLLNEVELLHPYSPYAKSALLKLAVTYHSQKDYENTRLSAERYIDFYPKDQDAAYAQYLIALSYYNEIDRGGRDQELTYKALQSFKLLTEKYPDSDYTKTGTLKFDLAYDHLARKEMDVGLFYLKRKQYSAAINRFRIVIEDFQTTSHTPEALHRLVECYLSLGLYKEAETTAAILGHNYQSSEFYRDSYELLNQKGLAPNVEKKSWLNKFYQNIVKGD